MLDELVVRNLGVIEEARLEPGSGFTVITGETGAGKTLLLGALHLLLGAGAGSELVGPFGDEATVEGRLIGADGIEMIAVRRLTRNGRSRAYLDGSLASADALEQRTVGVVEVVGQNDHVSAGRPSEVRALVDGALDDEGRAAIAEYRLRWASYQQLVGDRELLGGDRQKLERERDLARYQADEIEKSGVKSGEDEALVARLARLRNSEELRALLEAGGSRLASARDSLGDTVSAIRRAAALDPSFEALASALGDIEDRLGDSAIDLSRALADLEADPEELDIAETRNQVLADLKRKYGPDLDDVLRYMQEMTAKAASLGDLLDRSEHLDREISDARSALETAAAKLTAARQRTAGTLIGITVEHLRDLGFSSPLLRIEWESAEVGPSGSDTPHLLFASDSRLAPGSLTRTASGGELSRVVLCLRLAAGTPEARTYVFDEVDAGVGGATALALGRKLATLSEGRQVLCVTHLPQVAAFAGTHYLIQRDDLSATLRRIEGGDRVQELSRMLAGLPDSERGREAAEELLELAST